MSLIHELGHCLSATLNGGVVNGIIWRYGFLSETVRSGSDHPIVDIWLGPLCGVTIPFLLWIALRNFRYGHYLQWFSSICLMGNGLYLGLGWLEPGADASDLVLHGVHLMPILSCGVAFFMLGLFLLFWSKPPAHQPLPERSPP
jgi:hypothetical protein